MELCESYNNAVLAVERNNHGHTVLNVLKHQLCCPNLYEHRDYDAKRGIRSKLGWDTNVKSKPIMIDEIVRGIEDGHVTVWSRELLSECMTYVRNDRGGTGAESGCHDDRVMAMAIALQARKQPKYAIQDVAGRL
jgi:hypothetical protein